MKRILIIRSNPVNPDSRVEKIAVSLIKAGYYVEIFGWDRASNHNYIESTISIDSLNIKIVRIGIKASIGGGFKKNIIPLIKFQMKIAKWLSKNHQNYDILHACDFDTAYTARKMASKYDLNLVYDIFDYYVDSFSVPNALKSIVERFDLNVINNADITIICNEQRIKQISRAKPKKLVIIHNSPPDRLSELNNDVSILKSITNNPKIVYIGILGEGRMIKELTEAIGKNDSIELHIGGFGPLETFVEKSALQYKNIYFYGKMSYIQTLRIENQCDIITAIYDPKVKNHQFAAPNKFYEALMLGKPLVVCKSTGIDDIVNKNGLGVVVEYDIYSILSGINKLISERHNWDQIYNKNRELYKKEYSWAIMEERLVSIYDEMTKRR